MKLPRPRFTATGVVLGMLLLLMAASIAYTRESLLFCERAVFGEMQQLAKEGTLSKPVPFSEVCPELRQRVETNSQKWLEVLLALLVQLHPPGSGPGQQP